jgi:hypothetical protein
MTTEALVLAVVSVVRPTTAAVVWAMLVGTRPRRLLGCYLLAGMLVSLTTGIAVVLVVGGALSPRQVSARRATVLLVLGAAALVLAVAFALGWRSGPRPERPAADSRVHHLSPAGAATAGVVTHLPGVFYLAALSAIVATGVPAGGAVLQVVVYNLVWFSPALVSLGICLWGVAPAADRLDAPLAWARTHQGSLLAAISGLVGVWLIAEGVSDMA